MITKDMTVGEIVNTYPKAAVISIIPVLFFPDIHSEAENRS